MENKYFFSCVVLPFTFGLLFEFLEKEGLEEAGRERGRERVKGTEKRGKNSPLSLQNTKKKTPLLFFSLLPLASLPHSGTLDTCIAHALKMTKRENATACKSEELFSSSSFCLLAMVEPGAIDD